MEAFSKDALPPPDYSAHFCASCDTHVRSEYLIRSSCALQDSGVVVKKVKIGHIGTVGGDTTTQMRAVRVCSPNTQASVVVTAKTSNQPRTDLVSDPSDSQMPSPSPPPSLSLKLHTNPEGLSSPDVLPEPASDIQPSTSPSEPNASLPSLPILLILHVSHARAETRNPQATYSACSDPYSHADRVP